MTRHGIGVDVHRYFHVIEYRPRRSLIDLIVVYGARRLPCILFAARASFVRRNT